MRKMKKLMAALCACAASLLMAAAVTAAGPLDPDAESTLNVYVETEDTLIKGMPLHLYRVAERIDYTVYQPEEPFASYPINLTDPEWDEVAGTLAQYVIAEKPEPFMDGVTGEEGFAAFEGLKKGVYFVMGEETEQDGYKYRALPTFVILPDADLESGEWLYHKDIAVKIEKEPVEPEPELTEVEVFKVWNDEGRELNRPESITAKLLRDGEEYEAVELSEDNQWYFKWTELDSNCTWNVIEDPVPGYTTVIDQEGGAFAITNTPVPSEHPQGSIPVVKKVAGDEPKHKAYATFTFNLISENPSCPMPEGSSNQMKQLKITGPGSDSFGNMTFTAPGVYKYLVTEVNTKADGYTYDTSIYLVTFTVTGENDQYTLSRSIVKQGVEGEADTCLFVNTYKKLPQTGLYWWPVALLGSVGMVMLVSGVTMRRMSKRKEY